MIAFLSKHNKHPWPWNILLGDKNLVSGRALKMNSLLSGILMNSVASNKSIKIVWQAVIEWFLDNHPQYNQCLLPWISRSTSLGLLLHYLGITLGLVSSGDYLGKEKTTPFFYIPSIALKDILRFQVLPVLFWEICS